MTTPRETIEIGNGTLRAIIDPHGGELHHLHDSAGRELMTNADPAYWTGHAPLLFPIVGRLNGDVLRLDGAEYAMKQHGFARKSLWTIAEHAETRAVLQLTDDDQTRAQYPFSFLLEVAYTLDGATLTIAVRLENRSDAPLPASFGFHPAFAWPLPYGEAREAHRITFAADEPASLKALGQDGTIEPTLRPSPLDGRELRLRDALFEADALIWDPIESNSVTYGAAQGPTLTVTFPNTPRLGIWTKPGARFVCIEPWHGIADPEGFTGDFRQKPGVFEVAPRAQWNCSVSVTLKE